MTVEMHANQTRGETKSILKAKMVLLAGGLDQSQEAKTNLWLLLVVLDRKTRRRDGRRPEYIHVQRSQNPKPYKGVASDDVCHGVTRCLKVLIV